MTQVISPLPLLQQQAQQNPWYNPLSPSPDVAGGIRGRLNDMASMYEHERRAGLEERQMDVAERGAATAEKRAETDVKRMGISERYLKIQEDLANKGFGQGAADWVSEVFEGKISPDEYLKMPKSAQLELLGQAVKQQPGEIFGGKAAGFVAKAVGISEEAFNKLPQDKQVAFILQGVRIVEGAKDRAATLEKEFLKLQIEEEEKEFEVRTERLKKQATADAKVMDSTIDRIESEKKAIEAKLKPSGYMGEVDPQLVEMLTPTLQNIDSALNILYERKNASRGIAHDPMTQEAIKLAANIDAIKSGKYMEAYQRMLNKRYTEGAEDLQPMNFSQEEQAIGNMTDEQIIDAILQNPDMVPGVKEMLADPRAKGKDPKTLIGDYLEWFIKQAKEGKVQK